MIDAVVSVGQSAGLGGVIFGGKKNETFAPQSIDDTAQATATGVFRCSRNSRDPTPALAHSKRDLPGCKPPSRFVRARLRVPKIPHVTHPAGADELYRRDGIAFARRWTALFVSAAERVWSNAAGADRWRDLFALRATCDRATA